MRSTAGPGKHEVAPADRSRDAIAWLLDGDPAIRWQTLRDLVGASASVVERERSRVRREGWGARLLARQGAAGTWAAGRSSDGGLYNPKWTSTTYTMLLLRDLGLPAGDRRAQAACRILLDEGLQPDGGVAYGTRARSTRQGETCVTGMALSILAHFGLDDDRVDTIARHLLEQQMPDGGWNCRRAAGATHASVHTTISVLEGLRLYELDRGRKVPALAAAQRHGREFLLAHRLFRSHRTGRVMRSEFLRFAFPPRWHYDVLRALDHFQAVDAPRDPRLAEAIAILRGRRQSDGRWILEHSFPGKTHFELERVGRASRWQTLRALRVLGWWDGARRAGAAALDRRIAGDPHRPGQVKRGSDRVPWWPAGAGRDPGVAQHSAQDLRTGA